MSFPISVHADLGIRTVLVSPVPGDQIASGNALRDAVANIPAPSLTNRWVVKVEPGIFDLAFNPLSMRQWVDIEGSGNTRIVGRGRADIFGGVITGANNSEIRDVIVVAEGALDAGFPIALAIYLPNVTTKLTRVTAIGRYGTNATEAIFAHGGKPTLSHVTAKATGGSFTYGIALSSSSSASLEDVTILAEAATDTNTGILLVEQSDGEPTLSDVTISATGGQRSYGVVYQSFGGGTTSALLDLDSFRIEASGGSLENVGLKVEGGGGPVRVQASRILATGASSIGVHANPIHPARLENSIVGGDLHSVGGNLPSWGDGSAFVGGSQLLGGPAGALVVCAGVHDESYTFFASTCP